MVDTFKASGTSLLYEIQFFAVRWHHDLIGKLLMYNLLPISIYRYHTINNDITNKKIIKIGYQAIDFLSSHVSKYLHLRDHRWRGDSAVA